MAREGPNGDRNGVVGEQWRGCDVGDCGTRGSVELAEFGEEGFARGTSFESGGGWFGSAEERVVRGRAAWIFEWRRTRRWVVRRGSAAMERVAVGGPGQEWFCEVAARREVVCAHGRGLLRRARSL